MGGLLNSLPTFHTIYDKTGNVTEDAGGQRFAFDAENKQTKFFAYNNSGSTPNATYYYDGDGKRVRKIDGAKETVFVYNGAGSLIAEYETNFTPATANTKYLTQDHLGSSRAITSQTGAIVSRHDYRAFGEEVYSGTANRTNGQGYGKADGVRKQYTGYERDYESGLDFAQARYYNSKLGRFTSVDPLTASANVKDPQTFNRYSYVLNSPYKFTDPLGLIAYEGMYHAKQPEHGGGGGITSAMAMAWAAPMSNSQSQDGNRWAEVKKRIEGDDVFNDGGLAINPDSPEAQPQFVLDNSRVEPASSNPELRALERNLAALISDDTGIVRADNRGYRLGYPYVTHFETSDGRIHTIHAYGSDGRGNSNANLYVPSGWRVKYEGGADNQVVATNPRTGQVMVFAHVKGVKSQAQLVRNMRKTNKMGSRFIGQTGGKRGGHPGYKHSHISIYSSSRGRQKIKQQLYDPKPGQRGVPDQSGWSDFRLLIRK